MNLKRAFDICASAVGITLLSPLFAVISLASLAHFRKNPFYKAERLGKDGAVFSMLKLRTMDDTARADGTLAHDDERTSAYGHILRATALDEMPQLVNIFKGEMSFVGPRPRNPHEFAHDAIPDTHQDLLSVKPGLTGPWQIAAIGRKDAIPSAERLDLDVSYARSQPTFKNDMRIILQTIPALFKGHDGEYLGKPKGSGLDR